MVTLERLRKEAKLPRLALARQAGLTNQAIYMIERHGHQPKVETLRKISKPLAEALGSTPALVMAQLTAEEAQVPA